MSFRLLLAAEFAHVRISVPQHQVLRLVHQETEYLDFLLKQEINEVAAFALLIIDNTVFLQIHKYREPQVFLYQEIPYSIWQTA